MYEFLPIHRFWLLQRSQLKDLFPCPLADCAQYGDAALRDSPQFVGADVDQQVSALADYVHQHLHHALGGFPVFIASAIAPRVVQRHGRFPISAVGEYGNAVVAHLSIVAQAVAHSTVDKAAGLERAHVVGQLGALRRIHLVGGVEQDQADFAIIRQKLFELWLDLFVQILSKVPGVFQSEVPSVAKAVGLVPVLQLGIIQAEHDAVSLAGVRQRANDVLSIGRSHDVVVGGGAVVHGEAVVVLCGKDDVLYAERLRRHANPLVRVEGGGIEFIRELTILLYRNFRVFHQPFRAVSIDGSLPTAGGNGVKPPMDEQAVSRLAKPAHLFVVVHRGFLLHRVFLKNRLWPPDRNQGAKGVLARSIAVIQLVLRLIDFEITLQTEALQLLLEGVPFGVDIPNAGDELRHRRVHTGLQIGLQLIEFEGGFLVHVQRRHARVSGIGNIVLGGRFVEHLLVMAFRSDLSAVAGEGKEARNDAAAGPAAVDCGVQAISLIDRLFTVDALFVVVGRAPAGNAHVQVVFALHLRAVGRRQIALKGVEVVQPANCRHGIFAGAGDGELAGTGVVDGAAVIVAAAHAVGALQGSEGTIVPEAGRAAVVDGVLNGGKVARPQRRQSADGGLVAGHDQRGALRAIHGQRIGSVQAVLHQIREVLQTVAEGVAGRNVLDLAILQLGEGLVVIDKGIHQIGDVHALGDKADFILQTVAVGILVPEGDQHVAEFLGGGGLFHVQRVQPDLVDPHLVLDRAVHVQNHFRDAIDVAVGSRHLVAQVGIVLEHLLDIDGLVVDQVVQGDEDALGGEALLDLEVELLALLHVDLDGGLLVEGHHVLGLVEVAVVAAVHAEVKDELHELGGILDVVAPAGDDDVQVHGLAGLGVCGGLALVELDGDADLGPLLGQDHGDLLIGGVAAAKEHAELEAVGVAGLGEQGLGGLDVGHGRLQAQVAVLGGGVQDRAGGRGEAVGEGVDELLGVGGLEEGLADLLVCQVLVLHVERDPVDHGRGVGLGGHVGVALKLHHGGEGQVGGGVDVAALELDGAGRVVGDDLELDLLGQGQALEAIVRVGLHGQVLALLPLLDDEGADADGAVYVLLLAHLVEVGLGLHAQGEDAEVGQGGGGGDLGGHDDRGVVGALDLVDVGDALMPVGVGGLHGAIPRHFYIPHH